MLKLLVALFAGSLFGLGLAISGMMNPAKVAGFLDVAGEWDPTLAFVMGGALLITIPAFPLILKRAHPVLTDFFWIPNKSSLDARLIGGAAIFGVGWGLSGFCPGPAVAALAPALITGLVPVFAFVAAMLTGMILYKLLFERPVHRTVPRGSGLGSLNSRSGRS
jgi:hypothetical protein